ncbi:probable disease resistance protein At4g27220 [Corylus avellana]|uniref:probable disease resistance protein At4g27220 n=1 Tax=Corylus avellana TaxID=13451 RepID=UPI00286C54CB|nr:probable disease resistance protein At4g27220 [Corylus avellana]
MNYMDFESRMSTVKGLMEALGDANMNVIGMWGMAGVGKTTLARVVARQAKEEKLFEEVAMADVTQSPDPRRIQGEIADMLDLKFDKETESGRASRLHERLSQDRKILVILDDIWEKLELEKIGIPSKGCKLVLISRNRDVLFCEMGTQKDFGLEVLPKEEAWNLFENMAGDCVKDPNLRCVATEVAKECAGLPIAIVTVSKALKNKNLQEWKDALQLLRRPAPEDLTRMQSTIYSSIELSYSHLESDEIKYLFSRCAEMPFRINYLDLLKYFYGLGTFHGINTLEETRNRLYRLVRNLKDSCLLLDCPHSSEDYHMHDVVHDVATLIASKFHNMIIVRDDDGLKERLDGDVLKRCKEFSIRGGDFHELPNEMECPELRFLYVNGGDRSLHIPENFFQGKERLKVLDFTQMQLSSLPSSLPLVKNLRTLCLDGCVLDDIAVIGELKNLVILSLLGSHISKLPRELGLLTHLRLLDLSDCSKLKVIPPNVLSSLVELEELYMGNSFVQWEAEGLNNERNNANLAELKHLCHLTTLEIYIRDASSLPKDLLFEKLERYAIFVGDVWDWSDKRRTSRTLKLKMNTSFHSRIVIKMLLKGTENLYLDELNGVSSVLHELDREGFQQLKHLQIQNNPDINYIINSRMWVIAFPALETFLLKNMSGMEEICHGQLPLRSFCNLRVVKMEHCDKLKFVFSSSIARGLSQLEELEIRDCSSMGAIVVKEPEIEDADLILFPKLRCLVLRHLPNLKRFLSTQNSFITDAGEIIPEGKLDLFPILHEQVVFPNLERLELSLIDLEDIQRNQHRATRSSCRLENMQSTSRFQNLSHLEVQGSGNIKYLLSFSIASFMVQLKHLHILECKVMEEILVTEELGVVEETIPKVLFPRLECLFLKDLIVLKRFCIGSNIEFPSLKKLSIESCPKLKTFIAKHISSGMTVGKELKEMNADESSHTTVQPLFNEEVAFPNLKILRISRVDDMEIIWQNQFAVDSFCKLKTIEVEFCENLTGVFKSNMLARFQSLEELMVSDCCSLQEVFEMQGLNVKEAHTETAIQLKILYLARLPKMKHVWNKDPQKNFSFQNLKLVHAMQCESLKSFFPASVARCLMQLEELLIIDCGVEEIVAGEEGAEGEEDLTRFVFPQVIRLHLDRLPRLKWFYHGNHASDWPMLKDMLVGCCHKVDIFASELLSEALQESPLEISAKQPLFFG